MTAVSARRINRPSEASRKPQRCAASRSASVQPPSGPMARIALAARRPSRTFRSGGASARSESMTRKPSLNEANARPGSVTSTEPHAFAIAQLVELAGLGAQHASEMMGRLTFHDGVLTFKLLNEKTPSHAEILTQEERHYPKMSFTLSKIEELRSAGLFSIFKVAPSCSMSFRCSRVSFVGVNTQT